MNHALPPYIKRPKAGIPGDATDYQTVFAKNEGAVAALQQACISETLLETLKQVFILPL